MSLNIEAGLPTQIRNLEKRLKEMDASKVKPALIKEITDTIQNLKNLLKEKMDKREERKKAKEQATAPIEVEKEAISVPNAADVGAVSQNAPAPAAAPGAPAATPDDQKVSCPLCGGMTFNDNASYQQHMAYTHASDIMPTNPGQKQDNLVAAVEAPVAAPETAPKETVPQFKLDDVVKPTRGSESTGKVMRWDGKPSDLVYVSWESGPLADRDGFGGYYPHDLELFKEEPVEAAIPMEKPVCADCVSMKEKHGDLKTNYESLLKDLKEERDIHYTQGNSSWVARLDQKIQDLQNSIKEKFGIEPEACSACGQKKQSGIGFQPTSPELRKAITLLHSLDEDQLTNKAYIVGVLSAKGMHEAAELINEMSQDELEDFIVNNLEKEAGAQNAERLTVLDHTPPRANSGPDAGGKDTHDEFQDEWAMPAGVELESAKGAPGSLFDVKTAPHVVEQLQSFLNAPYINAQISTLGGDEHVSIMLTISADSKEKWTNNIMQNSRYGNFSINNDGTVEQFSGGFSKWKQPNNAMRKTHVKSVQQLIDVLNKFMAKVNTPAAPVTPSIPVDPNKTSALKAPIIAPTKLLVFKREFLATPLKDQQKFGGYEISQNGKKLFKINSSNSQPMSKEQIEFCAQIELTRGLKQAKLTEKIAFLEAGSTVYILAADKPQKRIKFASMEHGIRGWAPVSKFAFLAKEAEMRKHKDHIDNTFGHNGKEMLVDCPNGSGNMVWLPINELLPIQAPPATPESLNEDLGKDSAQSFQPGTKARISGGSGIDSDKIVTIVDHSLVKTDGRGIPTNVAGAYKPIDWNREVAFQYEDGNIGTMFKNRLMPVENTLESAKECPDCHGTFEGAEGATCPTCGRFAVQKEALRPALPPQILNRRQEVNAENNWPLCSVEGCNNKADSVGTEDNKRYCYTHSWGHKQKMKEAALDKIATVVHRTDGWHVLSEKGKNLGGPYKSKAEAVKRLRQVEYFKHHGILRPFSKQVYAEVLTDPYQTLSTHITEMRTRMDQVNERLQNAPAVKTAKEDAAPEMDLAALFADLTQGIDLLETKLGGDDIEPELHKGVEELENKLWTLEEKLGLTPKLSEHEKAEPEHKEVVEKAKEMDKEAADKENQWPLCSVDGCKNKADSVGTEDSKRYCYTHSWGHKQKMKEAAVVTDETIEETTNDPNATLTPPATATAPMGLQPTDFDGVDPKQMPTSPLPPGQRWVWDVENNKFIAMTDPTDPSKLV